MQKELLYAVSVPVNSVRPTVIDESLRYRLDEYRRYRGLFREASGHEIEWNRLSALVKGAKEVYKEVDVALHDFINFVDSLIKNIEGD